jgi:hypothetical protein
MKTPNVWKLLTIWLLTPNNEFGVTHEELRQIIVIFFYCNLPVYFLLYNIQQFYALPTQCIYVFVWIWEQTAIISLYNINWLVFKAETECVYCAVRTGYLNVHQFSLNRKMVTVLSLADKYRWLQYRACPSHGYSSYALSLNSKRTDGGTGERQNCTAAATYFSLARTSYALWSS